MKQYELFNDLPNSEWLQVSLYEVKVPGWLKESVWLNEFVWRIMIKNNIDNLDLWFFEALKYVYPLLKEWKLELKLSDPFTSNFNIINEYKKSEIDEWIEKMKDIWFKIKIKDVKKIYKEKNDFLEFNVQLKLPGGWYIY